MLKRIAATAMTLTVILASATSTHAQNRRHPYDRTYNGHRPTQYPWSDQGIANLRGVVDNITWGGNEAITRNHWDRESEWDAYDYPVFSERRGYRRSARFAGDVIRAVGSEVRATIRTNALMEEIRADRYRLSSRERLDAIDRDYGTDRNDRKRDIKDPDEEVTITNLTGYDVTIGVTRFPDARCNPDQGHVTVRLPPDRKIDILVHGPCKEAPVKTGDRAYAVVCQN